MSEPSTQVVPPKHVPAELDGARLDKAIQSLFSLSRAQAKRAIEDGAVRVNGRRAPKGASVSTGDALALDEARVVSVDAPATPEPSAPLEVVFADAAVLVVSKPPRQPTAPLRAGETGTLANALVGHYPELAGVGHSPREPGLVHRLDNETSGLVVVARTAEAFDALKQALKDGRLEKTYLLVCKSEGLADEGVIEFPIANHPKDQRRVYPCVHPRDVMRYAPRPASTRYQVVRRAEPWALVSVQVARALRHQIRAHFAAIGHPLAGDTLYGGPPAGALDRHALHAGRVWFAGAPPVPAFDASAPLPADIAEIVP